MESFKNDFGLPHGSDGFSNEKNASVSSNVVSLLTAGSFFGAIAAAFINEKWGRLYTLMGFCGIFNVGAAMQTAAHHDIALIYAGRVIAGVGIGGCSAVMSVFVSEAAPPKIRGRIAGLFQEMLVIGSTFAYWLGELDCAKFKCSVVLLTSPPQITAAQSTFLQARSNGESQCRSSSFSAASCSSVCSS
jgi:MFS family permease